MQENKRAGSNMILLATDFSARCDRAFDRAVQLAQQWKAHLAVVCAIERGSAPGPQQPSNRAAYETLLLAQRQVAKDLQKREIDFGVYIEESAPTELLTRLMKELQCDLVVTGTARSETFGRKLLGSTVERLTRQSAVPILVVKTRHYGPYQNVLIGTDFSPASAEAMRRAADQFPEASLTALHCYRQDTGPGHNSLGEARHRAEQESEDFLRSIPSNLRTRLDLLLEAGDLRAAVDAFYADRGVDLLVLGSTGRSRILEVILGGTASALLESAPCDVMIVPAPATV